MTDDMTLAIPVTVLRCSRPARLVRMRRTEWLPHGATLVRGGVAVDENDAAYGWVAYGNEPAELATPAWPEQGMPLSFDQMLAPAVEIDVVYRGLDWSRAVGSVNALLAKECAGAGVRVELDIAERAFLSVAQNQAARRHRRAQDAFASRF
ncbi:MAG TPA: hypothetical protein VE777_06270 [Gaiellales bacterium]|jgi:hypothetical protein|nr:hypothetical protein [Gaiellales bacterium]